MTLNQVVSRLKTLALAHKQIRYFDYDNIGEVLDKLKKVPYPACFIEHPQTTIGRVQSKHKFTIWFCDAINISEDARANTNDIESDLTAIAEDYFSMIKSSLFWDTWRIEQEEITVSYYEEKFEDLVGAVSFDVQIDITQPENRCQVPTSDPSLFIEQNPT